MHAASQREALFAKGRVRQQRRGIERERGQVGVLALVERGAHDGHREREHEQPQPGRDDHVGQRGQGGARRAALGAFGGGLLGAVRRSRERERDDDGRDGAEHEQHRHARQGQHGVQKADPGRQHAGKGNGDERALDFETRADAPPRERQAHVAEGGGHGKRDEQRRTQAAEPGEVRERERAAQVQHAAPGAQQHGRQALSRQRQAEEQRAEQRGRQQGGFGEGAHEQQRMLEAQKRDDRSRIDEQRGEQAGDANDERCHRRQGEPFARSPAFELARCFALRLDSRLLPSPCVAL